MPEVILRYTGWDSPVGRMIFLSGKQGLLRLDFPGRSLAENEHWARRHLGNEVVLLPDPDGHKLWRRRLERYFDGRKDAFVDGRLDLRGTEFQMEVWRRLIDIPYGSTSTYGQLAKDMDRAGAAQAVGQALHDNPIAIIVPCHRIVGREGELTGYAGGLGTKRFLLTLEGALHQPGLFDPRLPIR